MAATKRTSARANTGSRPYAAKLSDPDTRKRIEKALTRWTKRTDSFVTAVRASERLTDKDFAVRINAKG